MNENKIEQEFKKLIGELNDKQFWTYISGWLDEDFVLDIMNNWEIDVKKEAIKDIKKILKGGLK